MDNDTYVTFSQYTTTTDLKWSDKYLISVDFQIQKYCINLLEILLMIPHFKKLIDKLLTCSLMATCGSGVYSEHWTYIWWLFSVNLNMRSKEVSSTKGGQSFGLKKQITFQKVSSNFKSGQIKSSVVLKKMESNGKHSSTKRPGRPSGWWQNSFCDEEQPLHNIQLSLKETQSRDAFRYVNTVNLKHGNTQEHKWQK